MLTRGLPAPPSTGCSLRRWASASSAQAPYLSLRPFGRRSLAPLRLLSPQNLPFCGGPVQATGGGNICLIRGLPALFPAKFIILRGPLNPFTSSAEVNSACGKVLPPSGGKTLGRRTCGGTKSTILRGPRSGDWRGKHLPYSRPSSSSIHRLFTASLGIRQSPRGLRATEPTLGPSARQERLNC